MNRSRRIAVAIPALAVTALLAFVAFADTGASHEPAGNGRTPSARFAPLQPTPAPPETLFGPHTFTRSAGPPQTFTVRFSHCGSDSGCQLVVTNGDGTTGQHRVTSGSVVVNGSTVIGPGDWNPYSSTITRTLSLGATNTIEVRLVGRPGSTMTVTVTCPTPPADLVVGVPSAFAVAPGVVSIAVPITNEGAVEAGNVSVDTLTLAGGALVEALPISLGTIPAGGTAILTATFNGVFTPPAPGDLRIAGTYTIGTSTLCFASPVTLPLVLPPAGPGSAPLGSVTVFPHHVTGAPYTPQPPAFDDEDTNPAGWFVPNGPFIPGTPTPGTTGITGALLKSGTEPSPQERLAGTVVFQTNRGVGISSSTTAEPTGASGGGVVFTAFNWRAAYSTDNGLTWTQLDPTTIFPADEVGYCCDQIVMYSPAIDRFIWLLQGTGYRLAMASPADIIASHGTSWTYWNLTPQVFGQPLGTGFDYPDMAIGNADAYMSWDAGAGCPSGCTSGFQVVRTALTGIQAGGTITVEFTDPANGRMAWGSHLAQDPGPEMFWAGHNSSSQMRVFSLAENSNTYFWRDRNVSSWANNAPTSLTPDSRDWLAKNFNGPGGNSFPRNGVIGATRQGNLVWFGWTAGSNADFPQAHIEMVAFDRSNDFAKSQQVQVWNSTIAFGYPSLTTNICTGEVGMALEFGGGGNYENHAVGFWGDFVVYQTTSSNVGTTRFGDYVTLRRRPLGADNAGNLFDAFGYGLRSTAGGGTTVDVHYVTWGRPASACNVIGAQPAVAMSAIEPVAPAGPAFAVANNPMVRGSTLTLRFSVPKSMPARLRIYNAAGALVRTLVEGDLAAGDHSAAWNGRSDRNAVMAPGVYFASLDLADTRRTARIVVLP